MTITGKEVWEALKQDKEFMAQGFQNEKVGAVMLEYLENTFFEVIGGFVDKPATIANILETKIAYIKNAYENGLLSRAVKEMPDELFSLFDASGMIQMLEGIMIQAVEALEPIVKNVPAFLEESCVSEEFVYEQLKLSAENIDKAIKGDLTIGDILASQPAVILMINS